MSHVKVVILFFTLLENVRPFQSSSIFLLFSFLRQGDSQDSKAQSEIIGYTFNPRTQKAEAELLLSLRSAWSTL